VNPYVLAYGGLSRTAGSGMPSCVRPSTRRRSAGLPSGRRRPSPASALPSRFRPLLLPLAQVDLNPKKWTAYMTIWP
jgi:hypothetical protein